MTHLIQQQLLDHQQQLSNCKRCPKMIGPVIQGLAVESKILQIGQAPGIHEGRVGKPFGWTAGKTLFKWYASIDVDEELFRSKVYMAAVCRCFPGKHPIHGDRVPDKTEIAECSTWLATEMQLLKPRLILPVGKLAIAQIMPVKTLKEVIGIKHRLIFHGIETDVIPLPHPSGASTWHRMEPGKDLLLDALEEIRQHPAWQVMYS